MDVNTWASTSTAYNSFTTAINWSWAGLAISWFVVCIGLLFRCNERELIELNFAKQTMLIFLVLLRIPILFVLHYQGIVVDSLIDPLPKQFLNQQLTKTTIFCVAYLFDTIYSTASTANLFFK
jgi:hypothetical protein